MMKAASPPETLMPFGLLKEACRPTPSMYTLSPDPAKVVTLWVYCAFTRFHDRQVIHHEVLLLLRLQFYSCMSNSQAT